MSTIVFLNGFRKNPPPAPDPAQYNVGDIATLAIGYDVVFDNYAGSLTPGDEVAGADLNYVNIYRLNLARTNGPPNDFRTIFHFQNYSNGDDLGGTWVLMPCRELTVSPSYDTSFDEYMISSWRKVADL